jgi:hypothetical protein
VDWNDLVNVIGSTAILEHQGWLQGTLAVTSTGAVSVMCQVELASMLLIAQGAAAVYVDDVLLAGDHYMRNSFRGSLHLALGVHVVRLRARIKVCSLELCPF